MKKIESIMKKYLNDEVEKVHPLEFDNFILKAGRKSRGGKVPVPVLNFSFYSVLMLFIIASVLSAIYSPPRLSGRAARCYEITISEPGFSRAAISFKNFYFLIRKYYTEDNI